MNAVDVLILNGKGLTVEEVAEVALKGRKVEIAEEAFGRLKKGRELMQSLADSGKAIYGFNRGVGWNKDICVAQDEIDAYNYELIRTHALGVPPYHTDEEVRAMMVIRLNNMLIGTACATDELAKRYRDFLNHGIHPLIPQRGSVGDADITTLSHMGLTFSGEGDVRYHGEVVPAEEAIKEEGLPEYRLKLKDAHTIILSNAQGEGLTALLAVKTRQLVDLVNLIYCLDYEGLNGNVEAMCKEVNEIRGLPGQMESAARCREFLEGSYLYEPDENRALQDSLTFRGGFAIQGTVLDALHVVEKFLAIQINSPSDNPAIVLEKENTFVTANFETATLAAAVEMLAITLSHMSKAISYRMIKMTDPHFTGLTRYLAAWDGSSLGYATIQNTYTALDVENRFLTNPSSVDFYPMEGMIEDHGANLPLAAEKALKMVDNIYYLAGMEALYAAQAVDLRQMKFGELKLGKYTGKAYKAIRSCIPFLDENRNMHEEIKKIYAFMTSDEMGNILQ
ncbi:MAG: aromatic amino acid ammonia-lyase [Clostridia bacterium]|nr:aromatic amino acid ammonia-lyase [Clostridia bacterium]